MPVLLMMGHEEVKLLNTWVSMFGMRVIIALKEKGINFEYQEEEDLFSNKSPLLLQSNPIHKKVPVFFHHNKPICESLIILQYIDETWPHSGLCLLPHDPYHRALARFWADYIDKKLHDAAVRVIRSPRGETRDQAKNDIAECFRNLEVAYLEVSLGGPYFGGQRIGFLDIAVVPYICWVDAFETMGEYKLPIEHQCPNLHAWFTFIITHPSVKESLTLTPSSKVVEFCKSLRMSSLGTLD